MDNKVMVKLANAKKKAMQEIRELRFDGGTGYIWINDLQRPYPRMVMHPTVPSLEGKILDNPKYDNSQGIRKNLFVAFLDVTSDSSKDGYVDYLWPKPTPNGLTARKEKISYVKLHKPLGWIIGSGAYIDNIDDTIFK